MAVRETGIDKELTEEVVQETAISVVRNLERLPG